MTSSPTASFPAQALRWALPVSAFTLTALPAASAARPYGAPALHVGSLWLPGETWWDGGSTALEKCTNCVGLLDYPWFSYCVGHRPELVLPIMAIWGVALIWLLNTTAQHFFTPPLLYWSRLLRLRPEVAGATLLALGNGAPDVFAAATAAVREDLPLALSEILGCNVCILCVAGGASLFAIQWRRVAQAASEKPPEVQSVIKPFAPVFNGRHYSVTVIGLFLSLLYLSIILSTRAISMLMALMLPALYIMYLLVLITGHTSGDTTETVEDWYGPERPQGSFGELYGMGIPAGSSRLSLMGWAIAYPTYALRWAIIPCSDCRWDRQRRLATSFTPVGLTIFYGLVYGDGFASLGVGYGVLLSSVVGTLGVLIYLLTDDGPDLPIFYPAITLTAKVSSILALSAIAGELIAMVETLGILLRLPALYLGSTMIVWGNSIGDVVSNMAMVSAGQPRVALTGVLAGPLFNSLIGGGLALLLAAFDTGGSAVTLWEEGGGFAGASGIPSCELAAGFALTLAFEVLAALMLVAMLYSNQWNLDRWGYALLAVYAIFIPSLLLCEYTGVRALRPARAPS